MPEKASVVQCDECVHIDFEGFIIPMLFVLQLKKIKLISISLDVFDYLYYNYTSFLPIVWGSIKVTSLYILLHDFIHNDRIWSRQNLRIDSCVNKHIFEPVVALKPDFVVNEQQMCISACAFAQSDHRL